MAPHGLLNQPVAVHSYEEFVATFGDETAGYPNPFLPASAAAFFANGGQLLYVVRVEASDDASLIGSDGGTFFTRTGLQALRGVDVATVAVPGAVSQAVQEALIELCESTGDRLAILDPVSTTDANAVIDQRAGLSTSDGFATLWYPWVLAAPAGESMLLPPSGFVAGAIARTDPPTSPTGSVISATGLSAVVTSTQQGQLDPLGIDTIRMFVGQGVRFWGARTLASNTDWRYIAVRRMGSAIEESIERGTQWALSQPNDAALWAQLRSDVDDFMQGLFFAGWFQGSTPNQAYFVRCDATTMTAQDIAEGRTIILVGFAPIAPAEFLLLRIVQQRAPATAVSPGPPALSLRAPYPNPFRPRTTIEFDLPREESVSLRILDVGGRLVRTLESGRPMAAGRHTCGWDGRDDRGRAVAAGVYLARLTAGDHVLTQRVTRIR